ncbi:MAG: hypothetical protein K5930_09320 [Treponemataceae bacterium]|nr:hypothetical protein [Treponemataceae bacterium]
MYGYLKKAVIIFLIAFSFIGFLYSETYYNTISFHTQIYNRLKIDGYAPIRQPLLSSNSTQFPYNVIINSADPGSNLCIITDSTFAINNINLLEDLSNYAEIAITVNDTSFLPDDIAIDMPAGIRAYVASLQYPEDTALLILSPDENLTGEKCIIVPGAAGKLTPYSFFKNTIDSMQNQSISFSLKNSFLSLYRLNVTDYSKKLDVCLKEGCQAIQVDFSPEIKKSTLASFVENLLKELKNTKVDRNTNYTFIRLGVKNIIIPEMFSTIVLVLMTGTILFFLCGLSFTFGKKKDQHRMEFIKYWPLVPIVAFMFTILFYAAQFTTLVVVKNWEHYPVFTFLYKLLITCWFFRIFTLLRHIIKIPCTDFIYGYLLVISCLLNIYVFSAIDLSLFIPLAAVCIIAYLSRMTKKLTVLLLFTVLTIAPVIIFCILSLPYIQEDALLKLSDASFLINAMFSILILPFTFMVVRIFVSTGIPGRLPGRKRRIIGETIRTVVITLILITSAAIVTRTIKTEETEQVFHIEEKSNVLISSLRKEEKKDRTDFELVISSSLPVIRYDISADSETAMPFFYTNFPYEYNSSDGNIVFLLDENPPAPFVLTGSIAPSSSITFTVTSYMHDENNIYREDKTLSLSSGGR